MKSLLAIALASAALALPTAARAGDLRLGAQLLFSPDGSRALEYNDEVSSQDLAASYGATALVGYDVLPWLSVGVVPTALLDVRADFEGAEHFTALELAARVTGRLPLGTSGVELQLHAAPGYSWMIPSDDERTTASGWIATVGAGVVVPVSARVSLVGDIGQTFGRQQRWTQRFFSPREPAYWEEVRYSFDTLRIGLGVQATL